MSSPSRSIVQVGDLFYASRRKVLIVIREVKGARCVYSYTDTMETTHECRSDYEKWEPTWTLVHREGQAD